MRVAPSILSADFSRLAEEVDSLNGATDIIHIDVMDGHFVPNITIGPCVISALRKRTEMEFDTHLMISEPERYVEEFARAGADLITFHIETTKEPLRLIKKIRALGKKVGISINPETEIDPVLPFLRDIDLVLVMSVRPGFGGQAFMPESLEKIRMLDNARKINRAKKLLIEVDGGINETTAVLCRDAGADILVAGSYVFKAKDRKAAVKSLC